MQIHSRSQAATCAPSYPARLLAHSGIRLRPSAHRRAANRNCWNSPAGDWPFFACAARPRPAPFPADLAPAGPPAPATRWSPLRDRSPGRPLSRRSGRGDAGAPTPAGAPCAGRGSSCCSAAAEALEAGALASPPSGRGGSRALRAAARAGVACAGRGRGGAKGRRRALRRNTQLFLAECISR